MRQYDSCPLVLKYRYIDKAIPLEKWYFIHGQTVEDKYCGAITQSIGGVKPERTNSDYDLDAKALFGLETLRNDCLQYKFEFQKTFKQCRCKSCGGWSNITKDEREFGKCDHCGDLNFESWALVGVLDLYFPDWPRDRDLKTNSGEWTKESMQDIKRQALMYRHFTGKDLRFAVVNKLTHKAKVYPVTVTKFDDLRVRCEELLLAFELQAFAPIYSHKCKFCPFAHLCNK